MNDETSSKTMNIIGGKPQPALSGRTLENIDPATQACLSDIPRSDASDIEAAVRAAARAKDAWGRTSTTERSEVAEVIARKLEERVDELALLESEDTGKPLALARTIDIPRAIANFRFFGRAIVGGESACHEMAEALNYTLRRPLGIVGLITPWNLPLYLLTWKTAPALCMGNSIIAKPSEMTPRTASVLGEIIADSGAPTGVFNVVHGLGGEAGQALIEHPEVSAISFTGGTTTGARVAATAAPKFKKLSLELGGKNPTVVFADANFEDAVAGTARAGFTNQGQICLCGSRVFVERSIMGEFQAALVEEVKKLKVGDPRDPESNLGALISKDHRDKVAGYVGLAKEEGGEILHGGKAPDLQPPFDDGAFLEPTIIGGLSPTCRTAQEEIFGPVVTLHPFDSEDEVISLANGVRYGLSASVWTQDLGKAHRVSAALETGMVWVNTWLLRDLRVPFGGVKDSGVGREGGRYSLEFFSESKNICIKL